MRLGRKVENRIDLFLFENITDEIRGSNISLDEFEIGFVKDLFQVCQASAIIQVIIDDDLILRVLFAENDCYVRSNKA